MTAPAPTTTRIVVYSTPITKRRVRVAAARAGVSASDWVAALIRTALEGEPE